MQASESYNLKCLTFGFCPHFWLRCLCHTFKKKKKDTKLQVYIHLATFPGTNKTCVEVKHSSECTFFFYLTENKALTQVLLFLHKASRSLTIAWETAQMPVLPLDVGGGSQPPEKFLPHPAGVSRGSHIFLPSPPPPCPFIKWRVICDGLTMTVEGNSHLCLSPS